MSYMNGVKTASLMALLIALLMGICVSIGGMGFAVVGLIIGVVMNLGVYWYSDKLVLKMTRAIPADPVRYRKLHEMVDRLANKADIPKPELYIINDSNPNAFATGRGPGHAAIAVHTGLLHSLNDQEVEGVLGHELIHVKNRDTLISTIAAVIAGAISYMALMLMWFGDDSRSGYGWITAILAMLLAPIAAALIQMAISRSREYSADRGGAQISNPLWLASALGKIERSVDINPKRRGNQAMEQMYIINPFRGMKFSSWFSTHPPTKDRIKRLQTMVQI